MTVPTAFPWPNNGLLIRDVATLGYLRKDWRTLDPTYGEGVFWKCWRPDNLFASDLDRLKSPVGRSIDFRNLPLDIGMFKSIVLDGPYKLNGTSAEAGDARYGVDKKASWQERHALIMAGMTECSTRLERKGTFLLKCQDQVCSGQIRWQTIIFTLHADSLGLSLIDRFDMLGTSRPQPGGRRQVHAHGRPSTLLVFQRN